MKHRVSWYLSILKAWNSNLNGIELSPFVGHSCYNAENMDCSKLQSVCWSPVCCAYGSEGTLDASPFDSLLPASGSPVSSNPINEGGNSN